MYDILIKNDNTVVINNKSKYLIMQHSSMVDTLRVLVDKFYTEGQDMSEFTCIMEYLLPCTKKYKMEVLEQLVEDDTPEVEDKYKDYVKYTVPINSELTEEAGDVEIQFTFAKKSTDNYGGDTGNDQIRKTDKTKLTITPITEWANVRIDVFNDEMEKIITPIPSI